MKGISGENMLIYNPRMDLERPCTRKAIEQGGCYFPDAGLREAVNVALTLGQPLLVTGAPGTGKTGLAASIAYELGLGQPIKFETKSNSVSRELFYTYDALGRFQARETGLDASPIHYFTYNALGEAILRANAPEKVRRFLPKDFEHTSKQRSVVLIDEVDKAPRDFPNDLLNEIEHMYFRIPELGNVIISADPTMRPIVVITSNSEKDLPDPFLRRCIYYNIPFPTPERLRAIVTNRLGESVQGLDAYLDDALALFERLHNPTVELRKRPSTAELLGWVRVLRLQAPDAENPVRERQDILKGSLSALIKTAEDQELAWPVVIDWLAGVRK
jgi:MoxR-like ATPase